MVFTDHVLLFLFLWGAVGIIALVTGVSAVMSLARQLNRAAAVGSARVADREKALAA